MLHCRQTLEVGDSGRRHQRSADFLEWHGWCAYPNAVSLVVEKMVPVAGETLDNQHLLTTAGGCQNPRFWETTSKHATTSFYVTHLFNVCVNVVVKFSSCTRNHDICVPTTGTFLYDEGGTSRKLHHIKLQHQTSETTGIV